MVGSNGTMIAIRLVRSKLRKREEHSNSVHPVADPATTVVLEHTSVNNGSAAIVNNNTAAPTGGGGGGVVITTDNNGINGTIPAQQPPKTNTENNDPLAYKGQLLWQFPPQPVRCLYNNEQKNIVQANSEHSSSFVRGFRKNLGGKWRRLVKKKPSTEVYTIPAELKPQLKQIYVY